MTKTYKTRTKNGWRSWQADDAAHACEQHTDAFKGDDTEEILEVRLDNELLEAAGVPEFPEDEEQRRKSLPQAIEGEDVDEWQDAINAFSDLI